MNSLEEIASKKEQIQLEKEERVRMTALTKVERVVEKLRNMSTKNARAATKESKKNFNERWTKEAIEEVGTKLHE